MTENDEYPKKRLLYKERRFGLNHDAAVRKRLLEELAFAVENELHGLLDAEQIASWIRGKQ